MFWPVARGWLRRCASVALAAALVGGASAAWGQQPAASAPPAASAGPRLKIGVAGSAPFVVADGAERNGVAVDLWRLLASRNKIDYDLVPQPSVAEAIKLVQEGQLDGAIGPISITAERANRVTFTQPYYQASLAIMSVATEPSFWDKISPFFQKGFLVGIGVLLLVLASVGTLFWLVERKKNDQQFPAHPIAGIGNGVWLALVTLTTVGYGDRAPVTPAGRVVAGVWMLFAMIGASSLTASIATTLTVNQLNQNKIGTAEQLRRRKVAAIKGSTGEAFARRYGASIVQVANFDAGVQGLVGGQADAFVFDRPACQFHIKNHPEHSLQLSEASYEPQGYGFVLPRNTSQLHLYNIALLELSESGEIAKISRQWLGD